jgi:hypothetical protein
MSQQQMRPLKRKLSSITRRTPDPDDYADTWPSSSPDNLDEELKVVYHIKNGDLNKSSTRTRVTAANSNGTSTIEPTTNSSKRKLVRNFEDEDEDEDEFQRLANSKRKRTVAVPKTMGATVSRLVQGYEEKNLRQQVSNHQRWTVVSAAKRVGTNGRSSAVRRTVPPGQQPHVTDRRQPSPWVDVDTASGADSRFDITDSLTKADLLPDGSPRLWQCHHCHTYGIPYSFEAHILDELKCPHSPCEHLCCGNCVVGSAGEACEEKEWHSHPRGYWGWAQDNGGESESEVEELDGTDDGDYVVSESFL